MLDCNPEDRFGGGTANRRAAEAAPEPRTDCFGVWERRSVDAMRAAGCEAARGAEWCCCWLFAGRPGVAAAMLRGSAAAVGLSGPPAAVLSGCRAGFRPGFGVAGVRVR